MKTTEPRAARRISAGLCLVCALLAMCVPPVHAQMQPRTLLDSLLLEKISITGNAAFGEQELLDQLEMRPAPSRFAMFLYRNISERFPLAEEPRYFDYDLFTRDADVLTRFYRNHGFFAARVEGSYAIDTLKSAASVTFTVEEGAASYIDSIQYRYASRLPQDVEEEILRAPLLRKDARYSAENVSADIDRILEILHNSGFPRAYCDSVVVERKQSNNNVLVRIPLYFGRILYVGAIRDSVVGDDELNLARRIIYDRLDFKTGDVYSMLATDRAEANLRRLGIFQKSQLLPDIPAIGDTSRRDVPITIVMLPKKRNDIEPSLALNSMFGRLNGEAAITYQRRNVFGGAQTFSAKIDGVFKILKPLEGYQLLAQVRLDQPYLLSNLNSAWWVIAYIKAEERGVYGGDLQQNILGVKRQFTPRVQGSVEWTLEQTNYKNIGKPPANSVFAMYDTTGIDYRNSIISFTIERDMTNDFFNPTDGLKLGLIVEEAGLLKGVVPSLFSNRQSTQYYKTEGLVRWFHDLSHNRSAVLAMKLRGGFIFRYGESKERNIPVPFNRRYYAGGSTSVRGWGARKLSTSGEQAAAYGNNALVEASVEYRWQLFPTWKQWLSVEPDKIWLVLFADAGNIWDAPGSIRLTEMAGAFGLGLRYNLFFGPIKVDWGMRAYDPTVPDARWFTQRSFVRDILLKGTLHLGISHAF